MITLSASDRQLAKRLEAAESANIAAMAQAAISNLPAYSHIETAFEPVAGGTAVFAGVGSPMTHALGIGLDGDHSDAELERMEAFYRDRGSPCLIDLCPLADPGVIAFVQSRPYRVIEFNNIMVRPIAAAESFEVLPTLRDVTPAELRGWVQIISEGFADGLAPNEDTVDMMVACCSESQCWTVGEQLRAGGAAMGVRNRVALFYGDSILPAARRRGHQASLIQARLGSAQSQGCDLAMASVLPGSASHRNYERAGFQLIYMRVNLMREFS